MVCLDNCQDAAQIVNFSVLFVNIVYRLHYVVTTSTTVEMAVMKLIVPVSMGLEVCAKYACFFGTTVVLLHWSDTRIGLESDITAEDSRYDL